MDIKKRAVQDKAPASFAQERMWMLDRFSPSKSAYNCGGILHLEGPLDHTALQETIHAVVARHESLRTTYTIHNGQLIQQISPCTNILVPIEDMSDLGLTRAEEEANQLAVAEFRRPFDLLQGPVFRPLLIKVSPTKHLLLAAFHHIAVDGWSSSIFAKELASIYSALADNSPMPPPLEVQYADYAVWQRNSISGEKLGQHIGFWKSHLAGAPGAVEFPVSRKPSRLAKQDGAYRSKFLDPVVIRKLKLLSMRLNTSVFATMLACFAILIERWTTEADFVIGTITACRNRLELEQLIGCFINFLPTRHLVSRSESGAKVIKETQATIIAGIANQDCPFQELVRFSDYRGIQGRNPFYNVVFVLQNFPQFAVSTRSLRAELSPISNGAAYVDLLMAVTEVSGGASIRCDYRSDLFSTVDIDYLLDSYELVLQQMVDDPERPVQSFKLKPEVVSRRTTRPPEPEASDEGETLAMTATFTIAPLEHSLRFWMDKIGVRFKMRFGRYGQVFQDLLDPASILRANRRGMNVVLVRLEDLCPISRAAGPADQNPSFPLKLDQNVQELIGAVKTAAERFSVPILLCLCPESVSRMSADLRGQFQQYYGKIAAELSGKPHVRVMAPHDLQALYPVEDFEDTYANETAHIPYTQKYFDVLGTIIVRHFHRLITPAPKVIALDCDGTLWSGVCSEDGPAGVRISAGFRALQEFVLSRRDRGMLLCLCSKNESADVWRVFDENAEMLIKRQHITSSRINWHRKSANLKSLASELHLGLESFTFLDDDAVECAEVESFCPDVSTLRLPSNEGDIARFLKHVWAFDDSELTAEDQRRSQYYSENAQRDKSRAEFASLDDFLRGLRLEIEMSTMKAEEIARVCQLMLRTNQFNATGIRLTELELRDCLRSPNRECLVVKVRDRFGDYGLVGAVLKTENASAVEIENLVLSCRALGKRVEYQIVERLGRIANSRGVGTVRFRFVSTKRNEAIAAFFRRIGGKIDRRKTVPQTCAFAPDKLIYFSVADPR